MVPKVDYLHVREMLQQQRAAIMGKIRDKSKSHIIHDGLQFWQGMVASEGQELPPIDPSQIPGLRKYPRRASPEHLL